MWVLIPQSKTENHAGMLFREGRMVSDRYRLERPVGFGGMGTVWAATDVHVEERVAVKLLDAPNLPEGQAPTFAEREAEALSRLQHPNVVRFIDVHLAHRPPYVVTELIEGANALDQYVGAFAAKGEQMPLHEVRTLATQLGLACHHAHEEGIVHRDLKPQNVLVNAESTSPHAVILDFGIARLLSVQPSDYTTRGRVTGTTYYLSPEQILGGEQDRRVDVFALSTVVFEMLTGHRCWLTGPNGPIKAFVGSIPPDENDMGSVMHRILHSPRVDVKSLRPDVPDAWAEAIARGLRAPPDERPSSMLEWLATFGWETPDWVSGETMDGSEMLELHEGTPTDSVIEGPLRERILAAMEVVENPAPPAAGKTIEANEELSLVRAVPELMPGSDGGALQPRKLTPEHTGAELFPALLAASSARTPENRRSWAWTPSSSESSHHGRRLDPQEALSSHAQTKNHRSSPALGTPRPPEPGEAELRPPEVLEPPELPTEAPSLGDGSTPFSKPPGNRRPSLVRIVTLVAIATFLVLLGAAGALSIARIAPESVFSSSSGLGWQSALVRYRLESSRETRTVLDEVAESMARRMEPSMARQFRSLLRLSLESDEVEVVEMVFRRGEAWMVQPVGAAPVGLPAPKDDLGTEALD